MTGRKRKTPADNNTQAFHHVARKKVKTASQADDTISQSTADNEPGQCQPTEVEGEFGSDEGTAETSKTTHSHARRKRPTTSVVTKDEQVSFIIITRDNNKPDPYGASSTEHKPLPWPAVAKLYNTKYGVNVGMAAMEKRARTHREAWMAARPDYPRTIRYAEKGKVEKVKPAKEYVPRHKKTKQVDKVIGSKNTVKGSEEDDDMIDFELDAPVDAKLTTLRVAGWVPPDAVREQADLIHYFDYAPAATIANGTLAIQVEDAGQKPLGTVEVSMQYLRNASAWVARELACDTNANIKLINTSTAAFKRYLQCISPILHSELPQFDSSDNSDAFYHTPIDWDFAALAALYAVAAQLEDQHVQDLVIARWHEIFQQDAELKIDLGDLNHLFYSTSPGDQAREFWAAKVVNAGLAKQVVDDASCHTALVTMLAELMAEDVATLSLGCRQ